MLKKFAAIGLCLVLLCTCAACGQGETRTPEEGRSTVELYSYFTLRLTSCEMSSTHIGVDSWYNAVTSESVSVKLCTDEDGARRVLYRARTPFVFWYYPPYDYYDGTDYYYRYKGNWFLDNAGRLRRVNADDLFGIRKQFFDNKVVVSDAVYQSTTGYDLAATLQNADRTRNYELTGSTDLNFNFEKLEIKVYQFDVSKQEYKLASIYQYRFSHNNEGIPVDPPADFDPDRVANRLA